MKTILLIAGIMLAVTLTGFGQAPVIAIQPQSQSANAGTEVRLSVTATGALPLSYQWLSNGRNMPERTTAMLTLTNAQPQEVLVTADPPAKGKVKRHSS